MIFSKARPADLPEILDVYAAARVEMAAAGNPSQWGHDRPPRPSIERDIAQGCLYKATVGGRIAGVFALCRGDDPTYAVIYDGAWQVPPPYGAIHRIAHAPGVHGFFAEAIEVALALSPTLRADTHKDNAPMLRLLSKYGFTCRGVILTDNGTPRLAFDRPPRPPRSFDMKLDSAPFASIASGAKTVEMRLYDERRRPVAVGDTIVFENRANGARLPVTVRDLYLFENFRDLYAALPLSSLGYAPADFASASYRDMERYYAPERQAETGVVGILVERNQGEE